jgi:hypothetical protein
MICTFTGSVRSRNDATATANMYCVVVTGWKTIVRLEELLDERSAVT